MQPEGQNSGNPCSDSQFQAQNRQSLQQRRYKRAKPCSTYSARVPSRVDDASCLRCLASHELDSSLTAVRQWRQKRVLMRPEAAFPYVFAAEGAQHPPKKPPRSTPCRHEIIRRHEKNRRHAQQTAPQTTTARHAERTATKTFRRRGITIIPRDRADKDGEEP